MIPTPNRSLWRPNTRWYSSTHRVIAGSGIAGFPKIPYPIAAQVMDCDVCIAAAGRVTLIPHRASVSPTGVIATTGCDQTGQAKDAELSTKLHHHS